MRISILFTFVFWIFVLSVCGGALEPVEKSIASSEQVGYEKIKAPVIIENINSKSEKEMFHYQKPPQRVVAVWQNSMETLIALGVGDRIIAATGIPDKKYLKPEYQEQYEKIPYTALEPLAVENIMMMEPDLIVGWYSTFSSKALRGTAFWQKRGINTYIALSSSPLSRQGTLTEEYSYISDLGKIFDKEEKANELIGQMQTEIAYVAGKADHSENRPRTLIIEFLGKEISVYGKHTLAGDIVNNLGGALLEADSNKTSIEQIVDLEPDVIFLIITERNYGSEEFYLNRLYNHPALSHLRCVQNKRIFTIPLYAVYTPGVRAYDGIQTIARGLYPDIYKE